MRAIGLRASPSTVWFSVVEKTNPDQIEVLACQAIPVPVALRPPERLRFIRRTIADIIAEYEVGLAGIRLAEPIAQRIPIERLHLEGVLQELLASSSIQAYFYGAIARIANLLGLADRAEFKTFVEGKPFRDIALWEQMKPEERESILVAIAALALKLL